MIHCPRPLALLALLAGCVPLHYADWPALPGDDAADAAVADRAEVVAVDVPRADVVVVDTGDAVVVWITDRPDVAEAVDAPEAASADTGTADAGAPVDTGPAVDVPPTCGALEGLCAGACRSLLVDPAHCGACGRACPAPEGATAVCNGGACGVACAEGRATCGGVACGTDTRSDHANCGACGRECSGTQACREGSCVGCPAGESVCEGRCMDLSEDTRNCGSCGNQCPVGMACVRGSGCGWVTCSGGGPRPDGVRSIWTQCPDGCFDFENDDRHCGSCVRSCPSGQRCGGGFCR